MCATGECSTCRALADMELEPAAPLPPPAPRCMVLMCKRTADAVIACPTCGRQYQRCAGHGGPDGARRSLRSHKGLVHYQEKR